MILEQIVKDILKEEYDRMAERIVKEFKNEIVR
jgi:hypothetical protein